MAVCPKCGKRIKRKRKSTGLKECKRHGPIEKLKPRQSVGDIHVQ